ncbi:phosphopyruvate hydratase [Candidatus Beckwithbacteria bacterium CG22_combo_CG10-13_8_21_14_all_01_47_9]|uniref:Enolase n=3 Tax=Candidatus Beckwithiibacteriota TaxID=1752726 RepID=A0A2H0E157_9BACT|nr:MAG: phosphopyruvate hydratase [Candidatus Beckwithbacteria bacterium CG1_02_47_37]PIP87570.1 MAG: phosphopyruvate hydratase [Candidatus Beckwithbacteria bacterium CG22_combo_CG10-13_8_21_14_all_01_47_9]PJC66248.1 MAG: phosphopyruvate hydratase [Candidatus Beckwithbacteria bacterium CG_4_9_14_0_2_um_filter_47_11]
MVKIKKVEAMEVLDSRGNPTVAVWVEAGGKIGQAIVPSGASTGSHEAAELRDNDNRRFFGKGVLQAVENAEKMIGPAVIGTDVTDQEQIDEIMIELDATENKTRLGANAILGVSLAAARAAAEINQQPLYVYLRQKFFKDQGDTWLMPVPQLNLLNGGKHALGSADLQEFMIVPLGASDFSECLRWSAEIYQILKKNLLAKSLSVGVGDEGGFMPKMATNEQMLNLLVEAINQSGYKAGEQVGIALDPAASEIFESGEYILKTENKKLSSLGLIGVYEEWLKQYPIVSIEDGLAEDDWVNWKLMTERLGSKIQIVGDDLYVTNKSRLERGIKEKASNAVLVKLNQIGTLTETAEVINLVRKNDWAAVVSHRSGETEDNFIADLVVAAGTGQIKTGAPCRSERVAKYNRLLKIEKELGELAMFTNPFRK